MILGSAQPIISWSLSLIQLKSKDIMQENVVPSPGPNKLSMQWQGKGTKTPPFNPLASTSSLSNIQEVTRNPYVAQLNAILTK